MYREGKIVDPLPLRAPPARLGAFNPCLALLTVPTLAKTMNVTEPYPAEKRFPGNGSVV